MGREVSHNVQRTLFIYAEYGWMEGLKESEGESEGDRGDRIGKKQITLLAMSYLRPTYQKHSVDS